MLIPDFHHEQSLPTNHPIAGIDEVGRGCWAGPVVTAAVIFPQEIIQHGLSQGIVIRDSKTLSAKQRYVAEEYIKAVAMWAIGECSSAEIDQIGIGQATQLAMKRAVLALPNQPNYLLLDGRESVDLPIPQQSIIDGDAISISIAAASIIAKVYRDQLMTELNSQFPGYGFDQHVGYGTAAHIAALNQLGPSPIHRLSYKPIKRYLR